MYRFLEYTLLFVIVVLLQIFLFNNLNLSVYVNPLVYIAFVVMLPMEINRAALLLLGFLLGGVMDMIMGTAGINTIATLATAFLRPSVLTLTAGKEDVMGGGVPCIGRLGRKKYLRYLLVLILLQCFIFFTFESLTWSYYYLTLVRIVLSTLVTALLIYFFQFLFVIKGTAKN
ncbi:rod shape-determining protein MreD [Gallalistipes aquisgranensis]|uniref:rod shape-determining protein MreD n=1 Tax=Gallalistipes aquisgranensis TaxID=2779358 RepID=UPI001CF8BCFF|nr:rod shape-determining protein MreD [Gallalistipes aquisgranensis]MBE5033901.1 rod shape-determining protein MreD [Gallalistipes aquisgranensis]